MCVLLTLCVALQGMSVLDHAEKNGGKDTPSAVKRLQTKVREWLIDYKTQVLPLSCPSA